MLKRKLSPADLLKEAGNRYNGIGMATPQESPVYKRVNLTPVGVPFHQWETEPTLECYLETTEHALGNGEQVNKVTRRDNGQEELIGVNVRLQPYFEQLGQGLYKITRGSKIKSKTSGRSYYEYEVEFAEA